MLISAPAQRTAMREIPTGLTALGMTCVFFLVRRGMEVADRPGGRSLQKDINAWGIRPTL